MSNYEAKENRHNTIVGIFVVIALCALVWLIWMFKDLPINVSRLQSFQIIVQVPEAPGVQENTPVRFGGYPVGRVTEVVAPEPLEDLKTHKVYYQTKLILSIDKKFQNIPSNAEIKIMTKSLGSSYIELTVDPEKLPAPRLDPNDESSIFLQNGMVFQGSAGVTNEIFPEESQKKFDQLSDKLAKLLDNANDIIGDEENKKNINTTLANLSSVSAEASNSLKEFQKSIISVRIMSEDVGKVASQMQFILDKVNNGQGTAGKFVNDGRLYENLLTSTQQLNILMGELKMLISEYRKKGIRIKL